MRWSSVLDSVVELWKAITHYSIEYKKTRRLNCYTCEPMQFLAPKKTQRTIWPRQLKAEEKLVSFSVVRSRQGIEAVFLEDGLNSPGIHLIVLFSARICLQLDSYLDWMCTESASKKAKVQFQGHFQGIPFGLQLLFGVFKRIHIHSHLVEIIATVYESQLMSDDGRG